LSEWLGCQHCIAMVSNVSADDVCAALLVEAHRLGIGLCESVHAVELELMCTYGRLPNSVSVLEAFFPRGGLMVSPWVPHGHLLHWQPPQICALSNHARAGMGPVTHDFLSCVHTLLDPVALDLVYDLFEHRNVPMASKKGDGEATEDVASAATCAGACSFHTAPWQFKLRLWSYFGKEGTEQAIGICKYPCQRPGLRREVCAEEIHVLPGATEDQNKINIIGWTHSAHSAHLANIVDDTSAFPAKVGEDFGNPAAFHENQDVGNDTQPSTSSRICENTVTVCSCPAGELDGVKALQKQFRIDVVAGRSDDRLHKRVLTKSLFLKMAYRFIGERYWMNPWRAKMAFWIEHIRAQHAGPHVLVCIVGGEACEWERQQLDRGGCVWEAYADFGLYLKTCLHAEDLKHFLQCNAPLADCQRIAPA